MKRFLMACGALTLLFGSAHSAPAQFGSPGVGANVCPLEYICSLAAAGANPLTGSANDGKPASVVGFLFFESTGAVTGTVEINANGKIVTATGFTGTCTSGTGNKPGTIAVTTPEATVTYDFVVARSFGSIDLLLSTHSISPTSATPVNLGVCHASAAG